MTKKRILFVDDDPLILRGLKRSMRAYSSEWELHFASSGMEALDLVQEANYDVVVADMRMPGMSGADLLNQVMNISPRTIRFVLSGQTDQQSIMRCVGATHQFMSKPSNPEEIHATIERSAALDGVVASDNVRTIVGRVDTLPTIPSLYMELVKELQDPEVDIDRLTNRISEDVGLSAEMLKIVNSAFFGLRQTVSSVDEAVMYLGLDVVRSLVLVLNSFDQFSVMPSQVKEMEQLRRHSIELAVLCRNIAMHEALHALSIEKAFTGGMLHDIGRLILLSRLPDAYRAIKGRVSDGVDELRAEREEIRCTHADLGAYLLAIWGLPVDIVEAVAFHHEPSRANAPSFNTLTLVHVAEHMLGCSEEGASGCLDLGYVEGLQLNDKMSSWMELLEFEPAGKDRR